MMARVGSSYIAMKDAQRRMTDLQKWMLNQYPNDQAVLDAQRAMLRSRSPFKWLSKMEINWLDHPGKREGIYPAWEAWQAALLDWAAHAADYRMTEADAIRSQANKAVQRAREERASGAELGQRTKGPIAWKWPVVGLTLGTVVILGAMFVLPTGLAAGASRAASP
jgi:hypothetical protein